MIRDTPGSNEKLDWGTIKIFAFIIATCSALCGMIGAPTGKAILGVKIGAIIGCIVIAAVIYGLRSLEGAGSGLSS